MASQNKVFVKREFDCSVDELFDWFVEPERIAKWFGPKNVAVGQVKSDLTVGGFYSIELKKPDTESFFIQGEYLEINKPDKIIFTFNYTGLASPPPESVVTIYLSEIDKGRSELSLIQEFDVMPHDYANRTKAWAYMMDVLGELVIKTV